MSPQPLMCEPGGGGLFLPLFGEAEQSWDPKLRTGLYFAGLLWTFLGVAIIADIFMAAVEQVRPRRKRMALPLSSRAALPSPAPASALRVAESYAPRRATALPPS
jgi:hypothetical protein